jgi:hypothetical protein
MADVTVNVDPAFVHSYFLTLPPGDADKATFLTVVSGIAVFEIVGDGFQADAPLRTTLEIRVPKTEGLLGRAVSDKDGNPITSVMVAPSSFRMVGSPGIVAVDEASVDVITVDVPDPRQKFTGLAIECRVAVGNAVLFRVAFHATIKGA